MLPAWSYVVMVQVGDEPAWVLTAGAEPHSKYAIPGPTQNQAAWVARLARDNSLPDGAIVHVLRPTNNPDSNYCGHLSYRVWHRWDISPL